MGWCPTGRHLRSQAPAALCAWCLRWSDLWLVDRRIELGTCQTDRRRDSAGVRGAKSTCRGGIRVVHRNGHPARCVGRDAPCQRCLPSLRQPRHMARARRPTTDRTTVVIPPSPRNRSSVGRGRNRCSGLGRNAWAAALRDRVGGAPHHRRGMDGLDRLDAWSRGTGATAVSCVFQPPVSTANRRTCRCGATTAV